MDVSFALSTNLTRVANKVELETFIERMFQAHPELARCDDPEKFEQFRIELNNALKAAFHPEMDVYLLDEHGDEDIRFSDTAVFLISNNITLH